MGATPENIPTALKIGIRECIALNSGILTIITPLRDNLHRGALGDFLGHNATKRLMKGGTVLLDKTRVVLAHESVATIKKKDNGRVGLAFYVSKDAIHELDQLNFDCLIFVPWLDAEGVAWARKWNAETHGAVTQGAAVDLLPIAIDALKRLTKCINLSTGLCHPSDKEHAQRTFSELRPAGISWDPVEIEKWAVRNEWRADHARELAELSRKYI